MRRDNDGRLGIDASEPLEKDVGAINLMRERVRGIRRCASGADRGTDCDDVAPVCVGEVARSFARAKDVLSHEELALVSLRDRCQICGEGPLRMRRDDRESAREANAPVPSSLTTEAVRMDRCRRALSAKDDRLDEAAVEKCETRRDGEIAASARDGRRVAMVAVVELALRGNGSGRERRQHDQRDEQEKEQEAGRRTSTLE